MEWLFTIKPSRDDCFQQTKNYLFEERVMFHLCSVYFICALCSLRDLCLYFDCCTLLPVGWMCCNGCWMNIETIRLHTIQQRRCEVLVVDVVGCCRCCFCRCCGCYCVLVTKLMILLSPYTYGSTPQSISLLNCKVWVAQMNICVTCSL